MASFAVYTLQRGAHAPQKVYAMPKMGGPFIPTPKEVVRLLALEPTASLYYYMLMLCECFLEIDDDTDTDYVGAYIHESQRDLIAKLGGSGHLRSKVFPRWIELEVVEVRAGAFYVTKYYRKGDDFIQPRIMRKEINQLKEAQGVGQLKQKELDKVVSVMEGTIEHLLNLLSNRREVITSPRAGHRRETRRLPARNAPVTGAAVSLLSQDQEKIPLSVLNKVISIFYNGIGQKRITGTVRGSSLKAFRKLEKEGFTPYEIALAVDWTIDPENVKEKIRSFGIISSTISQALSEAEEAETAQAKAQEVQQADEDIKQRQVDETTKREALDAIKMEMVPDDRAELRDRALSELREMGVYQESMITDILISIQENEILRKDGKL